MSSGEDPVWPKTRYGALYLKRREIFNVVVVYHVTIVEIGLGLLKKVGPLVLGCVLRTTGS